MTIESETDFPLFGEWDGPGADAGALVFAVDREARVLMQLRDDRPQVNAAGCWAPFGGGVEAGETLREAALREFREETGLRLEAGALRPFGRSLGQAGGRSRLFVYAARLPAGPEAVRLGEGAGFALLTARQLRAAPLAAALRGMILHLADRLEAGDLPEAQGARPAPSGA